MNRDAPHPANGDLRRRIISALSEQVSEFISPDEFGGYVPHYGELVDIVLAEVRPEMERLLAANESLLAMLERMETQHVTFSGPSGEEIHPDWCRECRVDKVRASLTRVAREFDSLHGRYTVGPSNALRVVGLLLEDISKASAELRRLAQAPKEEPAVPHPAIPADAEGSPSFGQRCEAQGHIPAGRYYLTHGIEVDDNRHVIAHFDVPGGVNISGYWGSFKSRIEPAPVSGSDTAPDEDETSYVQYGQPWHDEMLNEDADRDSAHRESVDAVIERMRQFVGKRVLMTFPPSDEQDALSCLDDDQMAGKVAEVEAQVWVRMDYGSGMNALAEGFKIREVPAPSGVTSTDGGDR
jgi:hypothetical protein